MDCTIVGGDFNAKSILWVLKGPDARGQLLIDHLSSINLCILMLEIIQHLKCAKVSH